MSDYQAVNKRVLTPPFILLGFLALSAIIVLVVRFIYGMGAVSHLNNGYPWGVWIIYDVMIGTALGCGGYVLALAVYVMNKGKYHPLVRPALLASLFGYSLGAISATIDLGRYMNFYEMFNPAQQNLNSVLLEVGLCVATYTFVLMIEFLPPVLEKFKADKLRARLDKVIFIFIALGVLLPTMHQSSLGSLAIAMGRKINVIWQSVYLQPLFALMTALIMGFSIVIFEASFVCSGLKRPAETHLLKGLGQAACGLLIAFLLMRIADISYRGVWGAVFTANLAGLMFWLETILFVLPVLILLSPTFKKRGGPLLIAAISMILAGSLYRADMYLITFQPGEGFVYFPSAPELLITVGFVAIEILAYLFFVKKFPILPKAHELPSGSGAGAGAGQAQA